MPEEIKSINFEFYKRAFPSPLPLLDEVCLKNFIIVENGVGIASNEYWGECWARGWREQGEVVKMKF